MLFDRTVPKNKVLFARSVPANNLFVIIKSYNGLEMQIENLTFVQSTKLANILFTYYADTDIVS